MRYSEITKIIIKEDGDACAAPAASGGDTTSASVATVVSALGASTPKSKSKKKTKPIVLKRM